jgi:hypothetical protein
VIRHEQFVAPRKQAAANDGKLACRALRGNKLSMLHSPKSGFLNEDDGIIKRPVTNPNNVIVDEDPGEQWKPGLTCIRRAYGTMHSQAREIGFPVGFTPGPPHAA